MSNPQHRACQMTGSSAETAGLELADSDLPEGCVKVQAVRDQFAIAVQVPLSPDGVDSKVPLSSSRARCPSK